MWLVIFAKPYFLKITHCQRRQVSAGERALLNDVQLGRAQAAGVVASFEPARL